MKIVRNSLVFLSALIAILVVVGLFLPEQVHIERSATIGAPADVVFDIVGDFERFNEWSPWYALDPEADYVVSTPSRGVGASFRWQSEVPGVGSGSQQIIEIAEDRLVRIRMDFGDQGIALASYRLEPLDDQTTRITWSMDADFGYDLVGRYLGLTFDTWVGGDYEKGLTGLKALIESQQHNTTGDDSDEVAEPRPEDAPSG